MREAEGGPVAPAQGDSDFARMAADRVGQVQDVRHNLAWDDGVVVVQSLIGSHPPHLAAVCQPFCAAELTGADPPFCPIGHRHGHGADRTDHQRTNWPGEIRGSVWVRGPSHSAKHGGTYRSLHPGEAVVLGAPAIGSATVPHFRKALSTGESAVASNEDREIQMTDKSEPEQSGEQPIPPPPAGGAPPPPPQPTTPVEPPTGQPAPGYPPAQPAGYGYPQYYSGKRIPAGILGILLGAWGVHRFYLSDIGGGVLRILITLFTCGIGGIIGFIEGIIYLTKTDPEFDQIYVVQRREWF